MEKPLTGFELAERLEKAGFKIKSKTRSSLVVLVIGNRQQHLLKIASMLSPLGARIDSNLKGSSIGGIVIKNIRILIKADGATGGLDVESAALGILNAAVRSAVVENGGPITIKLKNKVVKGCVGVQKTPGTPKSDFNIFGMDGKPLIHISHKKGFKPNDFQQWGGMTETKIANDPEVKAFAADCLAKIGKKIPTGTSLYRKIRTKHLKMMAVFGVDYTKANSPNSVDVLIQGTPGLKKSGPYYVLESTGHVNYKGDIPTGGYEPVLAIIYKGDRDQFGISGARASIYPYGGRKFQGTI